MELDFQKDPAVLAKVIDAMADGIFTVDAHGRFIAWSSGAERITGYARDEVVGRPCNILEGPNCKGFATLKEMLAQPASCATEGICNQECKLLARDGRELYIHGNVRLITDEGGRICGAVGCFSDLTSFILSNEKIAVLQEQTRQRDSFDRLIGKSESMHEVFRRLRLAAQSDVAVFLSGESGTGKELAARAIHSVSPRANMPFIAVNCSAIPETLLESELFGHVKGAFTGAVKDKLGMFQAAEGGTLFLDEIGDLSPLLQLKLLRVLQEREVRRVGDQFGQPIDVRLITATNRDLKSLIAEGTFREDFYYRIHVFQIDMPSLRSRRDDIPLLVNHFIGELAKTYGQKVTGIARDALARLMEHDWPGNVRELRNAIEHAFVTVSGDRIMLVDLPQEIRSGDITEATSKPQGNGPQQPAALTDRQREERSRILAALRDTDGNKTAAARLLGISRVTMWKKAKKYGLDEVGSH